MSKALMCDRCGKTFVPDRIPPGQPMSKFRNPVLYDSGGFDQHHTLMTTRGEMFKHLCPDECVDLCPVCTVEFFGFFEIAENTPPNTEKDGV